MEPGKLSIRIKLCALCSRKFSAAFDFDLDFYPKNFSPCLRASVVELFCYLIFTETNGLSAITYRNGISADLVIPTRGVTAILPTL
jgi:hypothetical protein